MPVLVVSHQAALYLCASPSSQKARNPRYNNPGRVISACVSGVDLVLEGEALEVRGGATLDNVASAYAQRYGWEVGARDGGLHGDGAPGSGTATYHVYRVEPRKAFALTTDDARALTCWQF